MVHHENPSHAIVGNPRKRQRSPSSAAKELKQDQTSPNSSSRLSSEVQDTLNSFSRTGDETTSTSSPSCREWGVDVEEHPESAPECDSRHSSNISIEGCAGTASDTIECGTVEEDLVCYGTLIDIKAQLLVDPDTVTTYQAQSGMIFDVVRHGNIYGLKAQDDIVAGIDLVACQGLEQLRPYDVRLKAFVTMQEWISAIGRQRKKVRRSATINVALLVHGTVSVAETVGEVLSGAKLFLQHPIEFPAMISKKVHNPHLLQIAGRQSATQDLEQAEIGISDPTLQSLFESTFQDSFLRAASQDSRVLSDLREHQLIAVDFIVRKEKDTLPEPLNLWQARRTRNGIPYYEHLVTKEQRSGPKPKESEGGILADVMGSGKTATMLAVIVATLDESRCRWNNTLLKRRSASDEPARCSATLVVVPSVLILDNWMTEIEQRIQPNVLRLHKYHGWLKEISHDRLAPKDLVLTTYATVQADAGSKIWKFFCSVEWHRIILDEGER